jgi:hypothetical protein
MESIVKTVNQLPSRTLSDQFGTYSKSIEKTSKLHPETSLLHVKVHQTSKLPFPDQLNIQADLLATTIHQASTKHATDFRSLFTGTGCHLLAEVESILRFEMPSAMSALNSTVDLYTIDFNPTTYFAWPVCSTPCQANDFQRTIFP